MRGNQAIAKILKREGTESSSASRSTPDRRACAVRAPADRGADRADAGEHGRRLRTGLNGRPIGVAAVQHGPGRRTPSPAWPKRSRTARRCCSCPAATRRRRGRPTPSRRPATSAASRSGPPGSTSRAHPGVLRRAFTLLRTGRPAPVVLEVPTTSARPRTPAAVRHTGPPQAACAPPATRRTSARPPPCALQARAPLLHAGHGVLWAEAWDELRELAELLGAPVMTTMAGKSAFPEDHPWRPAPAGTPAPAPPPTCCRLRTSSSASAAASPRRSSPPRSRRARRWSRSPTTSGTSTRTTPATWRSLGDAKLVLRQLIEGCAGRAAAGAVGRGAAERGSRRRSGLPGTGMACRVPARLTRTRRRSTPTG